MSVEDRVLAFLKENPGSKPREIADALGVSLRRIRLALYKLRDRGEVARGGRGYIAITTRTPRFGGWRNTTYKDDKTIELDARVKALEAHVAKLAEDLDRVERVVRELKNSVAVIREKLETLEEEVIKLGRRL